MNGWGMRWILGVTPAEGDRPDGGGLDARFRRRQLLRP